MSPLWRDEIRVGLGPEGAAALSGLRRGANVTVILSSHHVRYALLPWSANLAGDEEWQAYAAFRFKDIHGVSAAEWEIRVSPSPKGAARVACAIERSMLSALQSAVATAGARLVSVQPGLMHAFNARRGDFGGEPGWLVAVEQGRLTLALIAGGLWELVRVRNVGAAWRDELSAILRREEMLAHREKSVARAVVMDNFLAAA